MVEVVVQVPADLSSEQVCDIFIAWVQSAGLASDEMTLKKYSGSIHWHLRKPGEKGTLEATWWPSKRRFWFSVHENRRADWQAMMLRAAEKLFAV